MSKLIKNIISDFDIEYISLYKTYTFSSSLENFKTIQLTQDLSHGINFETFEIRNFGVKRQFFNNDILIVDGDEL